MRMILMLLSVVVMHGQLALAESTYGLGVGTTAPAIDTKDVDGKRVNLAESTKKGPVVLVFYRGGWCPYCNVQLRALQSKLVPQLAALQASLIAISVDRVDEELKTKKAEGLTFSIISDPKAKILADYRVKYVVPAELVAKYKNEYKIDLEAASGEKHHIIAVPAVYVVDHSGKIAFAHVDEDYKKRAAEEDILQAVKSASKSQVN